MIHDWPKLKSQKGNAVAAELKFYCRSLELGIIKTKQDKALSLINILKNANDRSDGQYDELSNQERKVEFHNLCVIVNSIYHYFHSHEFHFCIKPAVFKETRDFWSYYQPKINQNRKVVSEEYCNY